MANNEELEEQKTSITGSQIFVALVISLGGMMVGFSNCWTSPALVSMNKTESTLHVTPAEADWVAGFGPLASLVGGLLGGPLVDFVGRRRTLSIGSVPFIASLIMLGVASNVMMVYIARLIVGVGIGVLSLANPIYLGETIHPDVRGTLGFFPTLFGNGGILLVNLVGWFLDWRLLSFFGAAMMVPFFIATFLVPETPQWYINRGRTKESRRALRWLRGGEHADIAVEFQEMLQVQEAHKYEENAGITALFKKGYRWPVFISLMLMFFQQMSGINYFMFFTTVFFEDADTGIDAFFCSIIVTAANVIATCIATLLIDRLGRKMLFISGVIMIISLVVVGIYFQIQPEGVKWLPLAALVVYVMGFSTGYGPVPWLMMGEILPGKIRGTAGALTTGCNFLLTFLIAKEANPLAEAIGKPNMMYLFAAFVLASLVFSSLLVPETKGRSLEDIEQEMMATKEETDTLQ